MSGPTGEMGPIRCARPGCRHPYSQHAPGGGNCMYWFPLNGDHCECNGFRWVPLADDPPTFRRAAS